MKVLITGAHFTPAQAVIEELQKIPGVDIIYIGRKHTREGDPTPSAESVLIPKMGIRYISIITGRLQRVFTIYTILSLLKIPIGLIQSFFILLRESPDVILSFGGYVSVPVVFCGWLLNIPIILHEQTLVSGLASTISSFFANVIAVSFDKDFKFSSKKLVLTGNPLRRDLLGSPKPSKEYERFFNQAKRDKKPVILIIGGNQGSHIINQTILQIIKPLTDLAFIVHQTGDSKFDDYSQLLEEKKGLETPSRYLVTKWIDGKDMGGVLKQVDLVISRAGANTLLELAYFRKPVILIPIPYLSRDEQNINARFFKDKGLAQVIPQSELTSENLLKLIKESLNNLEKLKDRAKEAKSVIIKDAAARLTQQVLIVGSKSE